MINYHNNYEVNNKERKKSFVEGLTSEVLELASPTWKTGKVKIKVTLEFYPDEPESPLDEIRKTLNS